MERLKVNSLKNPEGRTKIRIEYSDYSGKYEIARNRSVRRVERQKIMGFECSLICVKLLNKKWAVYVSSINRETTRTREKEVWQIKDKVPYFLGFFDD